ncbi:MAG: hypothetical protein JSR71_00305 [Proteobacteria bacterium]|nr:hypothetical protein [Pseudomonadota bacterium]
MNKKIAESNRENDLDHLFSKRKVNAKHLKNQSVNQTRLSTIGLLGYSVSQ